MGKSGPAGDMEAIGKLAGGIAHDFNQKLSAIIGFSELALRKISSSHPAYSYVEEIHSAGKNASAVLDQLLAFSGKGETHPVSLDLTVLVHGLEKELKALVGKEIEWETRLAKDLGKSRLDSGQVGRVILNLVSNARDATGKGGKIVVETSNVSGSHVRLSIRDSGTGMDADTLSRMYDPFFTTKEKGKGTGLGLSTVHGIVRQNGGQITVESAPGEGTLFSIDFPRVAETRREIPPLAEGPETVLLVEDEDEVRRMAREALLLSGYSVLEASHGDQALEISDGYDKPIDVMVTDIVMPGMSGRKLARKMTEKRPAMKVLYVSGYVDRGMPSPAVLESGSGFLRKPLTPELLTLKIREILGPVKSL